jgi:hypothetical protein
MRKVWVKLLTAMAVAFTMWASPAMAQATRTWVSGVGDDVNPCSRTAPCKTFAGAISKTAASGEINCLDSGGFGAVTITKAITIRCVGVVAAILVSGTNGITINAGATDKVVLDGLDIQGLGSVGNALNGVNILQARDVLIVNTTITGFTAAGAGNGVKVAGATQTRVTIQNSLIFGNTNGVLVAPPGAPTNSVKISTTKFDTNSANGISLVGAGASGYLSDSVIVGSAKSIDLQSGATLNSYGNNVLNGTTTDAPTLVPLG